MCRDRFYANVKEATGAMYDEGDDDYGHYGVDHDASDGTNNSRAGDGDGAQESARTARDPGYPMQVEGPVEGGTWGNRYLSIFAPLYS